MSYSVIPSDKFKKKQNGFYVVAVVLNNINQRYFVRGSFLVSVSNVMPT